VGFYIFGNSDSSKEVFVVFGSGTTVNKGSTKIPLQYDINNYLTIYVNFSFFPLAYYLKK